MPVCRIELLGELRVVCADREITRFRTQRTGALLGYLALNCPRACIRDQLVELIWPDAETGPGRHNLRTALSSLRRQLEPPGVPPGSVLVCGRNLVALNPDGVTTDVVLFEAALRLAARATSASEKVLAWTEAADAYRGELLTGHWDTWLLGERQRLAGLYFGTVERLVAHYEERRDYPSALDYAYRAVRADPLRDEAHRAVIRILAASDHPEAALKHYHEWERVAVRELGTAPAESTRALVSGIRSATPRPGDAPVCAGGAAVGTTRNAPEASVTAPAGRARLSSNLLAPPGADDAELLPNDTVTFLLADVAPPADGCGHAMDAYEADLSECRCLALEELERHGGREFGEAGDGVAAVFPSAMSALRCATALQAAAVPRLLPLRVALHTGDVTRIPRPDPISQPSWGQVRAVLQTAGRMLRAMHAGQILCSEETATILRRWLRSPSDLADLGSYRLAPGAPAERLFQVQYEAMPRAGFPLLRAEVAHTPRLPTPLTRFFGRSEELERLHETLRAPDVRLVTLTGPGGSGKTRLAVEAARQLLDHFQGAVWFAPLAEVDDAHSLPDALIGALGLTRVPGRDPLEQAVAFLVERRALLVLDNVEQVSVAGGQAVADLLARVACLTCLVTSRRALGVPGERLFRVMPLPVPSGEEDPEALLRCASVQLFVDRAQAVRPDCQVTPANASATAVLCARLEGMPLALELVAARAGALSPSQMLARLGDLLDWQVGQGGSGTERHRSLRAAIDWSYRLLPPELQRMFECLSVFRGGWSLDAAHAVCAEDRALPEEQSIESVLGLQRHSLVVAEERSGEVRFRMLEVLREYAWERLAERGEAGAARARHAEYFLGLAEEMGAHLQGWRQRQMSLGRLDLEHDNMRTVLTWAAETDPEAEARLAGALALFWEMRGCSGEGRRRLEAVLARGTQLPDHTRGKVLHGAARLAWYQGDFGRAGTLLQETLALRRRAGEVDEFAETLVALGDVFHRQSRLDEACALYRESLAIYRASGDLVGIAQALYRLGMSTSDTGDHAAAVPILEESLAAARRVGDRALISAVMSMLGHALFRLGRVDEARPHLHDALAIAQEVDDLWATVFAQWSLGMIAMVMGDLETPAAVFWAGMPRVAAMGNQWAIAYGLEAFGYLASASGCAVPAARLFGAAEALREAIGAPLPPANRPELGGVSAALRAGLGPEVFAHAWSAGRAMSWEEAVRYALEGWRQGPPAPA